MLVNMGNITTFDDAFQRAKMRWEKLAVGDILDQPKSSDESFDWFANTWPEVPIKANLDDILIGYSFKNMEHGRTRWHFRFCWSSLRSTQNERTQRDGFYHHSISVSDSSPNRNHSLNLSHLPIPILRKSPTRKILEVHFLHSD